MRRGVGKRAGSLDYDMQISFRANARSDICTRSFRNTPLNRLAKHEQGDEPDYQEDEEENLGDSYGCASDAGEAQQAGDDGDD